MHSSPGAIETTSKERRKKKVVSWMSRAIMMMSSNKRTRLGGLGDDEFQFELQKLPEGLVMEILSWLPIKTLIICRCVSKKWLYIISGSQFATVYRLRSPLHILFLSYGRRYAPLLKLANIGSCGSDFKVEKAEFNRKNHSLPCSHFALLNSCNGLVALYGGENPQELNKLYVCNPILSEYIKIPYSPHRDDKYSQCVGLGFSPRTNEYKVFRTFGTTVHNAEVYTINGGSGVWRSIGTTTTLTTTDCKVPKAFLLAALHWISHKGSEFISCFDFETEKFQQLPLPRCFEPIKQDPDNLIINLNLGVLGGCLVFFVQTHARTDFDMWVMKDYGIQDTWTKTRVKIMDHNFSDIPYRYAPTVFVSYQRILMIREYKSNNVLVCITVNRKSKCFQETPFRSTFSTNNSWYRVAYTPSFVSLYDLSKLGKVLKRGHIRKVYSWLLAARTRSGILNSPMIETTLCDVCFKDLGYVFRGQGIPMCQPCYNARHFDS